MLKGFITVAALANLLIFNAQADYNPYLIFGDQLYKNYNGKVEIINPEDQELKTLSGVKKIYLFGDIRIADELKNNLSSDAIRADLINKLASSNVQIANMDDFLKDQNIPRLKIFLEITGNQCSLESTYQLELYQVVKPLNNPKARILARTISHYSSVKLNGKNESVLFENKDMLGKELDKFISKLISVQTEVQEDVEIKPEISEKKQHKKTAS